MPQLRQRNLLNAERLINHGKNSALDSVTVLQTHENIMVTDRDQPGRLLSMTIRNFSHSIDPPVVNAVLAHPNQEAAWRYSLPAGTISRE
jgi:hypothetical protein